ncbi:GMP synthase [Candidatus Marinamargulisbacteria bacterium SCGC AG-343-D04]|nr:GMP synthase [Candidatus Marinamargulisbacteria bacterium SCGC AG-343-D04]
MNQEEFEKHLKEEHQNNSFSTYIKEIVYGGNDGIVTTFAVIAGFSGANIGSESLNLSIVIVLLFGLANLIADGAAMGLGNFLAIRSSQKLYQYNYDKELNETKKHKNFEIKETEYLFKKQGFTTQDSQLLTKIVSKNTDFWVKFMVQHECEIEDSTKESPLYNGLATFLSFIFFGFIPLIPYFFMSSINETFITASLFTCFALILLGMLRAVITKEKMWISVLETILIGGTAACLAYFVGYLFKG